MITGIAATWLPVSDIERAIAFYSGDLGLDVIEHDGEWCEVTTGEQLIGLNARESPSGDGGAVIAFAVDDLDRTVAELQAKGVEFSGEISEHPWGRLAPFKDPDGNDLQVYASPS